MAGQIPFVLRTRYDDSDSAEKISESLQKTIKNEKYIIICIGTDRSTGDSLGPMVGTILESNGFSAPVYGTLKSPVHAKNIEEIHKTIKQNHVGCKIIAIDACITFNELDIGDISITTDDFPMRPGCGVNKALIPIGDIAIRCNVLKGGRDANNVICALGNVRLGLIYDMAKVVARGIMEMEKSAAYDNLIFA